jgi:protein involved in polysaccharide export with SLBB domain
MMRKTWRPLLFCWLLTGTMRGDPAAVAPAAGSHGAPGPSPSRTEQAMPLVNTMEQLNDKQPISIGDRIGFRVVEDRDETRPLYVTDTGEVDFPYVGRLMVAGKTCKRVAEELKPLLEKDYYYHATVIIGLDTMSKVRGKVYVTGQVRTQGAQDIPADETFTVSKAILRAGGFSDFADKRRVKLFHKQKLSDKEAAVTVVDMVEVLEKGKAEKDPVVQSDDYIIVPQRLVNF